MGIRYSIDNSYTKQSTPCIGTVQSLQKQNLMCFVLPIKYVHVHPIAAIKQHHGYSWDFVQFQNTLWLIAQNSVACGKSAAQWMYM